MKELLVATGNHGKLRELEALLAGVVERVRSLADFPEIGAAVEDGATFEENAVKKAAHAALASGLPAIADDSGLVVDALGGRPGVYSARFAGEGAGDAANNARLLAELAEVRPEQRTAAFRSVIACCLPDGDCRIFAGEVRGIILTAPAGEGGFGYDPLFLIPEYGKTMAELPLTVKNRISHRGKAFALLKEFLVSRQA
jgi:XTP/dITP diphosphohydrolase